MWTAVAWWHAVLPPVAGGLLADVLYKEADLLLESVAELRRLRQAVVHRLVVCLVTVISPDLQQRLHLQHSNSNSFVNGEGFSSQACFFVCINKFL